MRKIEQVEV